MSANHIFILDESVKHLTKNLMQTTVGFLFSFDKRNSNIVLVIRLEAFKALKFLRLEISRNLNYFGQFGGILGKTPQVFTI